MSAAFRRLNPRSVLLVSILLVLGGTVRTLASFETTIAATAEASREFERRIDANEAVIAKTTYLQRMERAALAELLPFSTDTPAATLDRFVQDLEINASRRHVDVVSLTSSTEAPRAEAKLPRALVPTKFSVTIRGSFAEIVRFVQDLSRKRSLAELSMPKISAASATSSRLVESTLDVTLYRLVLSPGA